MKKILFCGGGSAGHVIEEKICKDNGIEFFKFDAVKFVRGKILCNLAIPFKLFKSIKQAKKIMNEIRPDLIFCKGGYVCIPPAFAGKKLNIPVLTHESDIDAGLANKIIASKCRKVLTAFPQTATKFKNGKFVGTPMRKSLFNRNRAEAKKLLQLDDRPTLIVFGGGSGFAVDEDYGRDVGEFRLAAVAFDLCKKINILHLCGKGNKLDTNIYGYRQIEFADDMGAVYACADYAVARCGSNSANELIALKIPTLFIPLENSASRGDQVKNAEYFLSEGLCRVLREKDLNDDSLKKEITEIFNDDKLKTALVKSKIECGNNAILNEIRLALR